MKVLIAEDEQWVMSSIKSLLLWDCKQVEIAGEAEDGEEALKFITSQPVDLLITDIRMPKMSGLDLLKHVKNTAAPIEVMVISGYDDFEYVSEALRQGAVDYILKPIDREYFVQAVEKVIALKEKRERIKREQSEWITMCSSLAEHIAVLLWENDEERLNRDMDQVIGQWFAPTYPQSVILERYKNFFTLLQKELEKLGGKLLESFETEDSVLDNIADYESLLHLFRLNVHRYLQQLRKERQWGYSRMIQEICDYLRSNYFEPDITLSKFSDLYDMSSAYLSQTFKNQTGQSFSQYLTHVRINRAKELLKNPKKKLYEIAEEVGYLDYPHFSKMFKKNTGETPADYRKKLGVYGY